VGFFGWVFSCQPWLSWRSLTKIAGSGSVSQKVRICGSGSVPKCHGSATLNCYQILKNRMRNFRTALAVLSSDLLRSCCVAASRSEPNCAKAATSLYWASSSFMLPATCFMDLVWAADPTRDTDRPTLIAGRIPGVTQHK
jgi:hypothetical protein